MAVIACAVTLEIHCIRAVYGCDSTRSNIGNTLNMAVYDYKTCAEEIHMNMVFLKIKKYTFVDFYMNRIIESYLNSKPQSQSQVTLAQSYTLKIFCFV